MNIVDSSHSAVTIAAVKASSKRSDNLLSCYSDTLLRSRTVMNSKLSSAIDYLNYSNCSFKVAKVDQCYFLDTKFC
jgi:hypothetical protein